MSKILKLREWNEILNYAKQIEEELKEKGAPIQIRIYSMYDGAKGISFQLFDAFGKFYKEYTSGIHGTVDEYKSALESNKRRVLDEY